MSKSSSPDESQKQGKARKALIEDLFQDFNRSRAEVYRLNFVRGLFFGLGSALGGTVVLALVVWLLTLFTDVVPGLQFMLDTANQSAQNTIGQ